MHKLSVISIVVLLALASIGLFIVTMSNSNPNAAQLNPALSHSPSSNSVPSTSSTGPNSLLSPNPPAQSSGGSDDGGSSGGG
ncbi:MAG: hypothetical protein ACYCQJ_07460 [Nitrososphaerales archaeon]